MKLNFQTGALAEPMNVSMLRSYSCSGVVYSVGTWNRRTRGKLNLASANVSVGSSHPEPQQPSLSGGWILQTQHESGGSGFEVLLSSLKEAELGMDQESLESGWNEKMQAQAKEEIKLVPEAKYVSGANIKKSSFIRVYYISALRVPARDSRELAQTLEEHLLNWQRVDNIARVPGDDVDEELESLFSGFEEWGHSNDRTVRSAIFDGDGTKKIESRTKKDVIKHEDLTVNGTYDSRKRIALKYQPFTVEMVDNQTGVDRHRSTLGFLQKQWEGPTRLLLLNEELVGKTFPQLPASIQALLDQKSKSRCQLVSCRLTLFYEYWTFEEVLRDLLPSEVMVPDAFERCGHVAFLNLSAEQFKFRHLIAQVTLDKYQPVVRSVVLKREARYTKSYAVRVEVLAGTTSLVTTVWENGCQFRIDFGSVIWDSRLKADRRRMIERFSKNDVVCDVFAGPGAVAISAGLTVRRTFANEVNPVAYKYLAHNVVVNKLTSRVEVFNVDTRQFLRNVFDPERPLPITQVVMSYPSSTAEFLDFFVGAFNRSTWELPFLPRVHLYGFSSAANPAEHFSEEIENMLRQRPKHMDVVLVAEVAPGEWILRASFTIPGQVGFGEKVPP